MMMLVLVMFVVLVIVMVRIHGRQIATILTKSLSTLTERDRDFIFLNVFQATELRPLRTCRCVSTLRRGCSEAQRMSPESLVNSLRFRARACIRICCQCTYRQLKAHRTTLGEFYMSAVACWKCGELFLVRQLSMRLID
jgi:hypothetical protein